MNTLYIRTIAFRDTTARVPLGVPENGRIAVKVINHYGDEVLKVYKLS